jgi:uncharacterized iron-regulated protein
MPPARRRFAAAALLAVLAGPAWTVAAPPAGGLLLADHPLAGRAFAADGRPSDEAALLAALLAADVAILGETHDNPAHRALQTRLLDALLAAGRRPAIVFEQIDRERQVALEAAQRLPEAAARVEAIGATFAAGWDWPSYRSLVERAVAADLPVFAGNLGRGALRPLVREGWTAVAAEARARLAIDAAWNPAREAYLSAVIERSHCNAIDAPLRDGLVRAQRLRDATLADAVLAAAGASANRRPVVLITGRGHARLDAGVPRYLAARAPELRIASLGITEVEAGENEVSAYLTERADGTAHDFLWLTPRFDRPDPCAAFGRQPR